VFMGAAHLLMQWAQLHCGRFYTFDRSIKEQHKLVTSGPYHYVQHPGYLSFLGTVVGVDIFTEFALINLYPAIMFFIVTSGIPVEEKMLQSEFGAEYTNYQKDRARILPGIF
jgi:protein-S-isoprenylcysteine O-methyltransferase Ste14